MKYVDITRKIGGIFDNYKNQMSIDHSKFIYNGLDRIDNDQGYILPNVVSSCSKCNMAKRTMSQWVQPQLKLRAVS